MAGHGSPPPPDQGRHPGRQVGRLPWGQGGPHPSLSDQQVADIAARVAKNQVRNRYLDDTIAEGEQLRREEIEDRYS